MFYRFGTGRYTEYRGGSRIFLGGEGAPLRNGVTDW